MPALLALAALSVQPVPVPTTEFAPLLLDVDGDGLRVGHVDDGVRFDVDADGTDELVAWTEPGTDDVLLAEDVTMDGRITTGAELLSGVSAGANGFESLRRFDSDGNGRFDAKDPAFHETLILWRDANHDGQSQSDELFTPPSLGLVDIVLAYLRETRTDESGNRFELMSPARVRNAAGVPTARMVRAVSLRFR